ncbi:hypothetical protein [Halopseudomonas sp.]|uniref:hypothetical protein n=1 Tax=Halopseudomonas sp. TaxID=2901191 RepID=UPI0035635A3F
MTAGTPLTHECIAHADQAPSLVSTVNILALVPPATLRQAVIRPTLTYLGVPSRSAENLLLGTLLVMAWLPPGKRPQGGIGPYGIPHALHTSIWDDYLASNADQASLIRGLASQRCFLRDPHAELGYNLAYATAIAWLIYRQQTLELGDNTNIDELAHVWQLMYPHRGARASDFLGSWELALQDESVVSL